MEKIKIKLSLDQRQAITRDLYNCLDSEEMESAYDVIICENLINAMKKIGIQKSKYVQISQGQAFALLIHYKQLLANNDFTANAIRELSSQLHKQITDKWGEIAI